MMYGRDGNGPMLILLILLIIQSNQTVVKSINNMQVIYGTCRRQQPFKQAVETFRLGVWHEEVEVEAEADGWISRLLDMISWIDKMDQF